MSAPLVKFRRRFDKIEQVECERETEQCVWIARYTGSKPTRQAKVSDYESYHDTWADAHALIVRRAESDVAVARHRLEDANTHLADIKGMKPPAA